MEEFVIDLARNWYKLKKVYRVCLYMVLIELMMRQESPVTIPAIYNDELSNDHILLVKIVYFLPKSNEETRNKLYSLYYDDYKNTIDNQVTN